ncbi:hypothetical protein AGMMS49965_05460 [Bacteroidia bacterium]|nr:hypothetical protein AGMMS49965_05460 [Bacteroidia bacterium]
MKFNFRKIGAVISVAIPLLVAVCAFIYLFVSLRCKLSSNPQFIETLEETRVNIITISSVLSGIIIAYLTSKVLQIRNEKIAKMPELNDLTQKLHRFRRIAWKLFKEFWTNSDGVNDFIEKYRMVSFFDVKSDMPSPKAKKFIEEMAESEYNNIAYFCLELRSFIDMTAVMSDMYILISEFDIPVPFNSKILRDWIDNGCGCGFLEFDKEYCSHLNKVPLTLNISKEAEESIKQLAVQIDKERYEQIDCTSTLFKLGMQIHYDIIPSLYRLHLQIEGKLPLLVKYLFWIFVLLIVFGVVLPLLSKILLLSTIVDIISISMTISLCIYIVFSFYGFLKSEIDVEYYPKFQNNIDLMAHYDCDTQIFKT